MEGKEGEQAGVHDKEGIEDVEEKEGEKSWKQRREDNQGGIRRKIRSMRRRRRRSNVAGER